MFSACAADSFSEACRICNKPCTDQMDICMGFPSTDTTDQTRLRVLQEVGDECIDIDLDSIDEWYVVYQLTFANSIRKAWFGDAKGLAILVIIFSGIWPYAKNLILIYLWYRPMTVEARTSILTWLLRLSKYTLVDVFAVIAILVGVLLELTPAGRDVAIRAEPRPAIIAFLLATVWEFTQIEWTVHLHNRLLHYGDEEPTPANNGDDDKEKQTPEAKEGTSSSSSTNNNFLMAMRFRTKLSSNKNEECVAPESLAGIWLWVLFLFVATLALYLSGATTELIQFTSIGVGDTAGCEKSYNLVTFGNAMISTLALTDNDALPATWTLYIAYVILVLLLPITVHCLQIIILTMAYMNVEKTKYKRLCRVASSLFGFSSVEVLLLGIFAIEYRFEKFVTALAGNDNAEFFEITSSLGPAFFILIGYSVASGLLQYFIFCATTEYYKIDPYHKVHVMWTYVMKCWLQKEK